MRSLELLAPAATADTAIEAIKHGADAVYIGGPAFGARQKASNSIEDIRRVVDFAHIFRVKVYVTVNTIIYDNEIAEVERMIRDLYTSGVDAVIVQDMGILRMDLPPIALHASTQCDTRTPEKARFLEEVGFSQIVLARELTLDEIGEICRSVTAPVECFVHGALCVSYSGRCHASYAATGRSANRGECSQICRLPFDLIDADGKILAKDKHLLSLKDLNASDRLEELIESGISSFKIEGRLKDADYVKNITAYYRQRIDNIIASNPDKYRRSSYGESRIAFEPVVEKSFNRGFTHYFLDNRRPGGLSQPLTPKSQGELITDVRQLHNGDGISFVDSKGNYTGVMVNGIRNGQIIGNRQFRLPKNAQIRRTYDKEWQQMLSRPTAERRLWVDVSMDRGGVTAVDERGVRARIPLEADIQKSRKEIDFKPYFSKLGNTPYRLRNFEAAGMSGLFIPASQLGVMRRKLFEALDTAARASYRFDKRRKENPSTGYPQRELTYEDNVSNGLAERFYREHGVTRVEPAVETFSPAKLNEGDCRSVMTTRHCILREAGMCLKERKGSKTAPRLPLTLVSGRHKFRLSFDCVRCEMHLMR